MAYTTPQAEPGQRKATDADARVATPNADGSTKILRFGDGLMLWVSKRQKMWRTKVQRNGSNSTLNLGRYPDVTIREAKAKCAAMKVADDPARAKRIARAEAIKTSETTFALIVDRWWRETSADERWTPRHRKLVGQRLAKHVLPAWGGRPIGDIGKEDVRVLVRRVHEKSGPAIGVAIKQYVTSALEYAVAFDLIEHNPAKSIAKHLPKLKAGDSKPNPHVRTIEEARAVLAAIEAPRPAGRECSPWTLLSHRLIALTGVRKTEALEAKWDEFDLDAAVWTIPAARMKSRRAHQVALSPQAIDVVRVARRIRKNEYVFASAGLSTARASQPFVSSGTLNSMMDFALRFAGLGRVMTVHGWRHSFSTILNEIEPASFRVVDVMLAHSGFRDAVGGDLKTTTERKYNHARHRTEQHRIACLWADMLLEEAASPLQLIDAGRNREGFASLEEKPASNVVRLKRVA